MGAVRFLVPAYWQAKVHQVAPLRNGPIPDERRRHVRHKVLSIIYVELGPGNGGILVTLGVGGLSLQAVAKLSLDTELTLHFRLPGAEAIEALGRVTWLGPTQKEAGISFKDLPSDTEQQIARWIASQEQPVDATQTESEPLPDPSPTRIGALRPPVQASIPVMFPPEKPGSSRPSLALGNSRQPFSKSPQRDDVSIASDTMAAPAPPPPYPTLPFRVRSEERFQLPLEKPLEAPADHYELLLEPEKPTLGAEEILPRDCVLPKISPTNEVISANRRVPAVRDSISPAKGVISADSRVPAVPDSMAPVPRRRQKFAIAAAACAVGILVLIAAVANRSKPLDSGSSGGQAVEVISAPAAMAPESAPPTAPAVRTDHGAASSPSAAAPTGANLPTPFYTTDQPGTIPRDGRWAAFMESLLSMDVPKEINPAVVGVPVWAVQHSGFYYCAYSPDFETLEQGTIMTQGDALQSGYQPKLGDYCR
jgi:PilZ domain